MMYALLYPSLGKTTVAYSKDTGTPSRYHAFETIDASLNEAVEQMKARHYKVCASAGPQSILMREK